MPSNLPYGVEVIATPQSVRNRMEAELAKMADEARRTGDMELLDRLARMSRAHAEQELSPHLYPNTAFNAGVPLGEPTINVAYDTNIASVRQEMIAMRLRARAGQFPFKHFATILAGEKVFVTVVDDKGEAVMFEDLEAEFPSDTLMAQLRLLL